MTTTNATATKASKVNEDINALLRARNPLLWVVTREETRVERAIIEAAASANFRTRSWDCAAGITGTDTVTGETTSISRDGDPVAALRWISESSDRFVYVMRDLHKWMDPMTVRTLRNLAKALPNAKRANARAIIIVAPTNEVPPELANHCTVLEYPLPCRVEMSAMLDRIIDNLPEEIRASAQSGTDREACVDAAMGLTAEEAAACFMRSVVTKKSIVPTIVAGEKKRVIAREKVLTWHDPDPRGLDAVGGLDVLKTWLKLVRARAFGLPAPKGVFLVGVPGAGKSLLAKCTATVFGCPLLRLDLGALRSKYVGESEGNIRKALQVMEGTGRCVVWLDEIEKALAGSTGQQGDGGVAADALGTILSWMQEREGEVFVIATANDVRALPPELLRKGRFDELFFVDLPNGSERGPILAASLRQHGRGASPVDVDAVASATAGFTGAEIAALVPEALFAAFADGERDVTTADVLAAAANVTPLSKTAPEKLADLRAWAKGRARLASAPEATSDAGSRQVEL